MPDRPADVLAKSVAVFRLGDEDDDACRQVGGVIGDLEPLALHRPVAGTQLRLDDERQRGTVLACTHPSGAASACSRR